MGTTTKLSLTDTLPLTCSRTGTCCFGKRVWINPWELSNLAHAKGLSPLEFRDRFTEFGGIRLKFDGKQSANKQAACSQYDHANGCSVHLGRPLVCRLYPLGRQLQSEQSHYLFQGTVFPCLEGCPEVIDLPQMSVAEYIAGQGTELFETAQNLYLALMEQIADGAFALLIESGLAESGDRKTIPLWRKIGNESPDQIAARIGTEWLNCLLLPNIPMNDNPSEFISEHHRLIETKAQELFGSLENEQSIRNASAQMMALALHLGKSLGAQPCDLAKQWISVAKSHGARE